MSSVTVPPEYNCTGIDFGDRAHLGYHGPPLLDIHAHVTRVAAQDDPEHALDQAERMLDVAADFGVARIWTMCPADDIPDLRAKFGTRLAFNGSIWKVSSDAPDDEAYRLLDRFLAQGVEIIKFWSAPRGRERGLFVDAPWRIEAARRARAAGVRVVMVHVADPDTWFANAYADTARYGTKADQYAGLVRMLDEFPDLTWIGAHMGGDPEHPDHLENLLERYPHLHFDTSATKWQVREVSARREAVRGLLCRHPGRFLFGSDLVTRQGLEREHYESRYWCQRTLWESTWEGRSPIADPDYTHAEAEPATPLLRGLGLPPEVLRQVYHENAVRILRLPGVKSA
jgi:predicted TIM-barrel fold metal-dependent hydrolase